MTSSRYGPWLAKWTEELWAGHSAQQALRILEFLPKPSPADRMLDLGCGTGRALEVFARAGWAVEGLDESPDMLRLARSRLEEFRRTGRATLRIGRVQSDLPNGPFDLVTALYNTLNHLASVGELRRLAGGIRRSLRPGSWFLGDLNTFRGFSSWHERETGSAEGWELAVWRHFDPTSGRALLRVSGTRRGETREEGIVNQAFEMKALAGAFRESGFAEVGFSPPDRPGENCADPESLDRVLLKARA